MQFSINSRFHFQQTRHNDDRNASNIDYDNNIEQLDAKSDTGSVVRYNRDGSIDLSTESSKCRSGSSSDGVFFSARTKCLDNRRLISKSQMKGILAFDSLIITGK